MIANFHYVTGNKRGEELLKEIKSYCRSGGQWVQLRVKNESFRVVLELAFQAKRITTHYNARLIINDFPEIARAVNSYGVHLGKNDMSPKEARSYLFDHQIIGSTCNTMEDIVEVNSKGLVDYVGLGPFRYTETKEKLSPVLGIEGLRLIKEKCNLLGVNLPLVVIGGVQLEDFEDIFNCGVHGIACSSLVEQYQDKEVLLNKVDSILQNELDYEKFETSG
ncbi:MAG: thiamine phosphate synthase [Bacteroidota bacterium]